MVDERKAASAARRQVILDAALASWLDDAQGGITIEAVARLSGASVGSIYHHFGGKEGIEAALYMELLARWRAALLEALPEEAGIEAAVSILVRQYLAWVEAHPGESRFLFKMRSSAGVGREEEALRADTGAFVALLAQRLKAAQQRGQLRAMPAAAYLSAIMGPAEHFARLWLDGRSQGVRPSEVSEALAAAAWRAVGFS
jgi:AcrR family transcriptional regulator